MVVSAAPPSSPPPKIAASHGCCSLSGVKINEQTRLSQPQGAPLPSTARGRVPQPFEALALGTHGGSSQMQPPHHHGPLELGHGWVLGVGFWMECEGFVVES